MIPVVEGVKKQSFAKLISVYYLEERRKKNQKRLDLVSHFMLSITNLVSIL